MNMRITTGMTQRNILADLNRVSDKLSRTQSKIASNREITRPSDDPFNAARALALRTSMESTQQYQRNIQDALGWQETAEIALSDITDALHRAQELAVDGASDTSPPEARLSIAAEIDQLIEGIKQNGNSTYRGRYVFAGTTTDAPPYVAGDDLYHGSPDDVERQIGPGVALSIGLRADSFLGNGGDGKLLQVLRDVSTHLKADDGPALRGDLDLLGAKEDELLGARALNGARQNRLDAALTRLTEVEESTLKQLSETEDVDIAKAMIDFTSQQAAYQAALKAGASIVQSSLMDFLR
jgi:flagellar hook-associated protein 3 FlgL